MYRADKGVVSVNICHVATLRIHGNGSICHHKRVPSPSLPITFINVRYFWNEFPIGLYVYCSVLRFQDRVNVKTKMSAVVLE